MSQEKSKTMPMQIFFLGGLGGGGGVKEVYYGICASSEYLCVRSHVIVTRTCFPCFTEFVQRWQNWPPMPENTIKP